MATVAQIAPVLLLALVVESRFFRFTYADAVPSSRVARRAIRKEMPFVDYWSWRAFTAGRRWGLGVIASSALVMLLAISVMLALILLGRDESPSTATTTFFIISLTAGALAAGVLPMHGQIVQRNMQLGQLEDELAAAIQEKERRELAQRESEAELAAQSTKTNQSSIARWFRSLGPRT
ncbi:sensor histidine kinase YesM [Microbacterium trichothecenolyticum]|uniref:hypothetical protein n=1 Tax=Microbacterium trichothecenolyticum TaxID=69370 RepID=UPI002858AD5F|nr:hypothetical protein [Microbacterium trichothecenolyticum]MDR7111425.1 sensor histidine kinase YesM [Microbacterium trichothecenolyticum]